MTKPPLLGWSLIWSAAPIPNPICFSILLYADKVALLIIIVYIDSFQHGSLLRIRGHFCIRTVWRRLWRVMRRVPRRVTARGGEGDPGGGLIAVFLSLPQETQVLLAVAERERGHAVGTAGLIGQVHPRFRLNKDFDVGVRFVPKVFGHDSGRPVVVVVVT